MFFFFQAEDGIRDRNVTGVQTCALPISAAALPQGHRTGGPRRPAHAGRGKPCGHPRRPPPGPAAQGVRPALPARLAQGPHAQPAPDRRRGVGTGLRGQRTHTRRAHQPPPGPVPGRRLRDRHRARPGLPARGPMTPVTRWQVAGRVVLAVLAVLSAFTVGWLLAQLLFHFTGHPPALVAYLVAAVLGLVVGALASALFARVTGRGDRHLLEDIR